MPVATITDMSTIRPPNLPRPTYPQRDENGKFVLHDDTLCIVYDNLVREEEYWRNQTYRLENERARLEREVPINMALLQKTVDEITVAARKSAEYSQRCRNRNNSGLAVQAACCTIL